MTWTPDAQDIFRTFSAIYDAFPDVRDAGLLQSSLERPQVQLYGNPQYVTIHEKCASLLDSLCRNHALVDGNKRCAWIAVRLTYYRNLGAVWVLGDDEAYDLVIEVSSTHLDVAEIARRLERGFQQINH
ncbi:toxin Doc [Glutamicibacter uratoxydans]|uniref:Toxin Doc n=1 Tax=Glutamicibacter uratoxydans TaxID=43667 RepID=A0A4Y4DRJ4_GLUUR|nr:Fic family protein [Glutamicibacter uratoxydans]GED07959.1 toxin Doc [Glutamicibacter uratoxydans]